MNTLIYTSVLGFTTMLMEVLNLRKFIVPLAVIGLAVIFGLNLQDWNQPSTHFNDMLGVSNFSVAFSGLALFITMIILVMAGEYYTNDENHISDYVTILIFITAGAMMMMSFNNLVMMFLGIETLSIALYALAGSKRFDTRSNEAGFKYFLMGSFASAILLFGIALVYGSVHSFHLSLISSFISENSTLPPRFITGVILIGFAMLFKVSAAPFHFWAPDVYEGAPALITAFMSTLVKIAGFAALYRLVTIGFNNGTPQTDQMLYVVAILTLLTGNLSALAQDNFKRLMAYSGISHAGYMLLIVLSAKSHVSSTLFYYSAAYAVAGLAAFSVALPVFKSTGSELLSAFNGLGKKNPVMAAGLTMAMIGMAGIPPFAGFFGKFYLFTKAFESGLFYIVLLAVINSMIGVYYYFKVIMAMYGKQPDETQIENPLSYQLVMWVCTALSLIWGIVPSLLTDLLL